MANDPATKPEAENGTGAAADPNINANTLAPGAKSNGAAAMKSTDDGYCRCLFVYQVLVGYVVEVKVRDHSNQHFGRTDYIEYRFSSRLLQPMEILFICNSQTGQGRSYVLRRIQLPHQLFNNPQNGPAGARQ